MARGGGRSISGEQFVYLREGFGGRTRPWASVARGMASV